MWFAALMLVPAAPVPGASQDPPLVKPNTVYASEGTVLLVTVQPGHRQRYALVSENVAADPAKRSRGEHVYAGEEARLRFVRLDLKTGKATVVKEFGPPAPAPMLFDRCVAYSRDGRIAYCQGIGKPFSLHIVGPDGRTSSLVRGKSVDMLLRPVWHPDSTHLLFFEYFLGGPRPRQDPVLATIRSRGTVSERALPSDALSSQDTAWSVDGGSIYSSVALNEKTVQLQRTSYPSLAREPIADYSLGSIWEHSDLPTFLVAEESGDVVWLASRNDGGASGGFDVWRLPLGGRPERARLVLDGRPRRMALSPDGELLALAWEDGSLSVARISTGIQQPVRGVSLARAEPPFVLWALGGSALLVEEGGQGRLSLVPISRESLGLAAGRQEPALHRLSAATLAIVLVALLWTAQPAWRKVRARQR